MADNDDKIKISELDPALTLDNTSETVVNKEVSGSWVTFKMTIATLAAHILEAFSSSSLRTTNKTVVGAINELQQGGGGGGSSTLAGLTDVNLTSPTNNQILKYDSTSGKWINGTGGGGGASALTDLSDVDVSNLVNNQVLKYNSETQKWENTNVNTYSTSEQIVGSWVDGSPVYQKTIYNAGGVTGNFNFPHGITNFGKLLSYEGTVSDSSFAQYGDIWVVPRIASDGNSIGIDKVSTTSIYMINPNAFGTRLFDWYITLRYTKSST